jgi:hypothetical protein
MFYILFGDLIMEQPEPSQNFVLHPFWGKSPKVRGIPKISLELIVNPI